MKIADIIIGFIRFALVLVVPYGVVFFWGEHWSNDLAYFVMIFLMGVLTWALLPRSDSPRKEDPIRIILTDAENENDGMGD
ncbi:MAG: hypothetical protein Rubg2KO_34150 [Rubricoccaceae bacterium]